MTRYQIFAVCFFLSFLSYFFFFFLRYITQRPVWGGPFIIYYCQKQANMKKTKKIKIKFKVHTGLLLILKLFYCIKFILILASSDYTQNSSLKILFFSPKSFTIFSGHLFIPCFLSHLKFTSFGTNLPSFPLIKSISIPYTFKKFSLLGRFFLLILISY